MASSPSYAAAVVLSLFLAVGAANAAPAPEAAGAPTAAPTSGAAYSLEDACKQTGPHYDLCMATLSADKSAKSSDTVGLARVAILAVQKNASETATYLSSIYDDDSIENKTLQLQQCLEDCSERYEAAVEQLTDATVALDQGAYNEARALVVSSQAEIKLCQRGCQAVPEHRNILTLRNREVDRLCSIAFTITKLIRPSPNAAG
uniref:Pectinesterase inhibitor domain-containing protein n=1 Tax=Leersia perrieri TaxID=77586 RepID=A0A0D9V071_9ORYZ